MSKSIIIKRINIEGTIDHTNNTWSDALTALRRFDYNGAKEQEIGNWFVKNNATNWTVTYRGDDYGVAERDLLGG